MDLAASALTYVLQKNLPEAVNHSDALHSEWQSRPDECHGHCEPNRRLYLNGGGSKNAIAAQTEPFRAFFIPFRCRKPADGQDLPQSPAPSSPPPAQSRLYCRPAPRGHALFSAAAAQGSAAADAALAAALRLTSGVVYPGLDLRREIRAVQRQELGTGGH